MAKEKEHLTYISGNYRVSNHKDDLEFWTIINLETRKFTTLKTSEEVIGQIYL